MWKNFKSKLDIFSLLLEFALSFMLMFLSICISHVLRDLIVFPIATGIVYGAFIVIFSIYRLNICINPAIAVNELLHQRQTCLAQVFLIIFLEILGGYLGSLSAYSITKKSYSYSQQHFVLPNGDASGILEMFLAEMLFSSLIVLIHSEGKAVQAIGGRGVIIGAVMISAYWAIGPISGGALNPIVSVGTDFTFLTIHRTLNEQKLVIYLVAPIFSSFISWFLMQLISQFLWAELIGTFYTTLYLLCIVSNKYSFHSKVYKKNQFETISGMHSDSAFSIALIYMAVIYAFGRISGAHYNPSISLGSLMNSNNRVNDTFIYCIVQIFGGILGALGTFKICGSLPPVHNILDEGDKNGQILLFAILFSMLLMAVYTIKLAKAFGDPSGFLIGFVYFCDYLWTNGKSQINPAITISLYVTQIIYGKTVDILNVILTSLVPIGGALFCMALIKNIPEGRRVDSN